MQIYYQLCPAIDGNRVAGYRSYIGQIDHVRRYAGPVCSTNAKRLGAEHNRGLATAIARRAAAAHNLPEDANRGAHGAGFHNLHGHDVRLAHKFCYKAVGRLPV